MRRRFEFRLARLLRVRSLSERMARTAWGSAQVEEARAVQTHAERRDELYASRARLSDSLRSGHLRAQEVLTAQRVMDGQQQAVVGASEVALTRRAQSQALERAWRERERDRRALAELEVRARTRHREELEKRDNAEADEVAAQRAARRGPDGGAAASQPR